jgi:hypothetical protein
VSLFVIAYDLNRPGQDYERLHASINALPGVVRHCQLSTWIVDTNLSAVQIRDNLQVDYNDSLLVAEATGAIAWNNLDLDCDDWLRT